MSASTTLFWVVFTVFTAWASANSAGHSVQGSLWAIVSMGLFPSQYYSSDDAKQAGEAVAATLMGTLLQTFFVFPLDLQALVLAKKSDSPESMYFVIHTVQALCLSDAIFLICVLLLSGYSRFVFIF